jgi:hypothetical protein
LLERGDVAFRRARAVIRKTRCTFMIEPDVLDRLQSIAARTGLSKSEQIRQGIQWWLDSREWPIRGGRSPSAPDRDRERLPRARKRKA